MVSEFKLSNGIRVVFEKIPKGRKNLSIGLFAIVGSRYEPIDLNGISHFVEHIQFSGTATRNKAQLNMDVDNIGETNAFTSKDCTFYYINTVKSRLDPALELFSDMFCNLNFDEKDINREQRIIREEIGRAIDMPFESLFDKVWENGFGNEGIGLPVLGKLNKINKFSVPTINAFISSFYVSNNIILSIAGDIDKDVLKTKLENTFCNFRHAKSSTEITPQKCSFNIRKYKKKINDVYVCFSLAGTQYDHDDTSYIRVINEILGSGFSSKLFQKIREDLGLAYSVYSFVSNFQDFGLLDIVAATTKDNYKQLIEEVKKELKMFKDTVTDKNIADAKAKLTLYAEINNDDMEDKIYGNAVKFAFIKNPRYDLNSYVKKINAIKPKKIRENIEKYITNKKYALTIFGNIYNDRF